MRHSSLSKLFWGLFLLFFSISIAHLELLTTSLGMLLLVTAIWQLRPNGSWLKRAFAFSIAVATVKAAEIVLVCLRQGSEITFSLTGGLTATGNMGVAFWMSLLGTVCMLALLYNLFQGLSLIAKQMDDALIAQRLYSCFWIYLAVVMMSYVTLLFPVLMFISFVLLFVLFVYILVQVHRFGIAADAYEALKEHRLGGRFYGAMGGAILLVMGASFAALLSMSAPAVHTQAYAVQNSTSERSQTVKLRQKLRTLGFQQAVLADLPDSEILRYRGAQSVRTEIQKYSSDGGSVRMTEYFTQFPADEVRILDYYEWLTLPRHRYCDSFYMDMYSPLISVLPESGIAGFALYDEKTAGGTATRKVEFLKLQVNRGMKPLVKYRLLGNEAVHQRGFLAYFVQIPKGQEGNTAQIIANCTHQTSFLDFGETDRQTNQERTQFFMMQSSYAEQQFQLMFYAQYDPKLNGKSSAS